MAYGISIQSSNGDAQIDSEGSLSYLKIISTGTATNVNVSPGQLLFIRLPSSGLGSPASNGSLKSFGADGLTSPPKYKFYNEDYVSPIAMDYVIASAIRASAPASPQYGIRVYNSDGELSFDSGIFISGTAGENVVVVKVNIPLNSPTLNGDVTVSPQSIIYKASDYKSVYMNATVGNYLSATIRPGGYRWYNGDIRYSSYVNIFTPVYPSPTTDIIGVTVV